MFLDALHNESEVRSEALRKHVSVARDLLHVLALETNGSVFSLNTLKHKKYLKINLN